MDDPQQGHISHADVHSKVGPACNVGKGKGFGAGKEHSHNSPVNARHYGEILQGFDVDEIRQAYEYAGYSADVQRIWISACAENKIPVIIYALSADDDKDHDFLHGLENRHLEYIAGTSEHPYEAYDKCNAHKNMANAQVIEHFVIIQSCHMLKQLLHPVIPPVI